MINFFKKNHEISFESEDEANIKNLMIKIATCCTVIQFESNIKKIALIITKQKYYHIFEEEDLKKLMMSPKYWKEQDPATLKKVSDGFL